jgi:hypothetical protein
MMARLCPPGGQLSPDAVRRMPREFILAVLFCERDKDGNPLIDVRGV